MENIDLNKDLWLCTTSIGDQEIMNLVITHLQSVNVRVYPALTTEELSDGPVHLNYCYLGMNADAQPLEVGAYARIEYEMFDKFKKLSLKELLELVEKLKEENGKV
jgi:hypothetical protein